MNNELIIKNIIKDKIINIELISESSNKVYKVITNKEVLYVKFYENNSFHIDNELKLYDLVDHKYLKELYYRSDNPNMAIFRELNGKTIDELSSKELDKYKDIIIDSVCDYFNNLSKNKTNKYGILDNNLNGLYVDFYEFLKVRQESTSNILKEYVNLNKISMFLLDKYKDIIIKDNSLVPIDTNLKNIMVLNDGSIKFIDPGEMISGPILMGYGDFVAHIYKTVLYDKLMVKLNLNNRDEKLLRIYAIFSSLNILAFLKKNGVNDLDKVIPYGNSYTFYELINEHLEYLGYNFNL